MFPSEPRPVARQFWSGLWRFVTAQAPLQLWRLRLGELDSCSVSEIDCRAIDRVNPNSLTSEHRRVVVYSLDNGRLRMESRLALSHFVGGALLIRRVPSGYCFSKGVFRMKKNCFRRAFRFGVWVVGLSLIHI